MPYRLALKIYCEYKKMDRRPPATRASKATEKASRQNFVGWRFIGRRLLALLRGEAAEGRHRLPGGGAPLLRDPGIDVLVKNHKAKTAFEVISSSF